MRHGAPDHRKMKEFADEIYARLSSKSLGSASIGFKLCLTIANGTMERLWRYATEYNVYFLAALRTALGTDFGLSETPGFPATGEFPIHFTGPTGLTFNYADAHDGWHGAPQLFWLASAFDQPAYAAAQLPHASSKPSALDLLWGGAWLTETRAAAAAPLALGSLRDATGSFAAGLWMVAAIAALVTVFVAATIVLLARAPAPGQA